jgi:hypothetical protein
MKMNSYVLFYTVIMNSSYPIRMLKRNNEFNLIGIAFHIAAFNFTLK